MAKLRQNPANRRATYHGTTHKEEEPIKDNINVGGKPAEPTKVTRKHGDIRFWLQDRQRRESAKRGPPDGGATNINPTKPAVNDIGNSKNNSPPLDLRDETKGNHYKRRNTTTYRRVLSHVEITAPTPKKPRSFRRIAQTPLQLPTPRSSASSASSVMDDNNLRRSARATRKSVNYADPQPRQSSVSADSVSSVFEDQGSVVSESDLIMDASTEDAVSSSPVSEDEDEDEQPRSKRQKTSATRANGLKKQSKLAEADIDFSDSHEPGENNEPDGEDDNAKSKGKKKDIIIDEDHPTLHMQRLLSKNEVRGVHLSLPPLSNIQDIFSDLTAKSITRPRPPQNTFNTLPVQLPKGTVRPKLPDLLKTLGNRSLRVATMCSGTESPLLAMGMIQDSAKELLADGSNLKIEHVFSAEIEPFKQAYIERNFRPPIIFRDIRDITNSKDGYATTAYGAKVEIPGNVDLVVAGTACVDFSPLNNHQRGLDGPGGSESKDTFLAVLNYAKRYRPAILILENVKGAPWGGMLTKYHEIGYAASRVLVDTKDYYLPQTRQRGYMVCYDMEKFKPATGHKAVLLQFCEIMQELRRPVSSSISSFLVTNDHPDVIRQRRSLARRALLDSVTRDYPWEKCQIRHLDYREKENLGEGRPLTGWQECGTLVLPEYCDKHYFRSQVPRVWDVTDMAVLRKASGKDSDGAYDVQYKTRIWDLSQNVDRFEDTAPFGISGCLTPSGWFYVTDRGGSLTPKETLMIQGLPIEKISFTTETERNIQDLAGNAMSTTVVGAAMLASLIAGHEIFQQEAGHSDLMDIVDTKADESTIKPSVTHANSDDLARTELSSSMSLSNIDLHELCNDAARSAKQCCCEGQIDVTERGIQICKDCNHTACITCGVKPSHRYQHLKQDQRDRPEVFIQKWQPRMPMVVEFESVSGVQDLIESRLQTAQKTSCSTEAFVTAVLNAIEHPLTFKNFRRSTTWTITYDSPYAILDLVIGHDSCEWRLFLKPEAHLPGDDKLRIFAAQSIAKACFDGSGMSHWSWRVPALQSFELTIEAQGEKVPSWFTKIGLPAHKNKKEIWPELQIGSNHDPDMLSISISGTYTHLPNCGTAEGSLYKRTSPIGAPDMYFFLDPSRIGKISDDCFHFASDHSRLEYDQSREVVAKISPKSQFRPRNLAESSTVQALAEGIWVADPISSLTVSRTSQQMGLAQGGLMNTDCSEPKRLVSLKFSVPFPVGKRFIGERLVESDDKTFFDAFGWAMKNIRGLDVNDHCGILTDHQATQCPSICAPPLPTTRWTLIKNALHPFEDPESATSYEVALKNRPQPFLVKSKISDNSVEIDIDVNVLSLCQRAAGKLGRRTNKLDKVCWTLDTNWANNDTTMSNTFTLCDNADELPCVHSYLQKPLFTKQQRSLTWMKLQESDETEPFVLEEIEESLMPHIGYRLEACATAEIKVKGGILADHAGFGKTITSLALISSEFEEKGSAQNIIESMVDLEMGDEKRPLPQKIAATLVICPSHLVDQWASEVKDMIGQNWVPFTIVINNLNQFAKLTVRDFEKARIIIVSAGVIYTDSYLGYLASFAGVPKPVSSKPLPREFKSWLDRAAQYVPKHQQLRDARKKPTRDEFEGLLKAAYEGHMKDDDFLRSFIKSTKRLKGEQYRTKAQELAEAGQVQNDMEEAVVVAPKIDNRVHRGVLLEMFHYNRIIVDEISYSNPLEIVAYSSLNADKRWGLSATPALKDTFDVASVARLLGLDLPIGASSQGMVSTANVKVMRKNMTSLDAFETYRDSPSHIMQTKIHALAQAFLDKFVRQNNQSFEDFPYSDLILPTTMNADQQLVYTDRSVKLNSSDMRLRKVSQKTKRANEAEGVSKAEGLFSTVDAKTAEEALVKTAALLDNRVNGLRTLATACINSQTCAKSELRVKLEAAHKAATTIPGHDSDTCRLKQWSKGLVAKGTFGDSPTGTEVLAMVEEICPDTGSDKVKGSSKSSKSKKRKHDEQEESESVEDKKSAKNIKKSPAETARDKQLNDRYSEVITAIKAFVTSVRTCRFVHGAMRYENNKNTTTCDRQGDHCAARTTQDRTAKAEDLSISTVCGHVMCENCFEDCEADSDMCRAQGCFQEIQQFSLLRFSKLGDDTVRPDGQKSQDLVDLLRLIQKRGDQAVLFVQYEDQSARLADILQREGIRFLWQEPGRDNGAHEEFANSEGTKNKATVLMLNSGDSSAAGKNFQNANHVIFFSPLLLETQHSYQAQMAQAIGRVRRFGQNKKIFVYRMACLNTIDVDILEQRELQNRVLYQFRFSDDFDDIDHRMKFDINALNTGSSEPAIVKENQITDAVPDFGTMNKRMEANRLRQNRQPLERTQLIRDPDDDTIKLVPMSDLVNDPNELLGVRRIPNYDDFSSLIKFSRTFSEDG